MQKQETINAIKFGVLATTMALAIGYAALEARANHRAARENDTIGIAKPIPIKVDGKTLKTIRATELGAGFFSDLQNGKLDNMIVEFQEGDELPVTLKAEGDLIYTTYSSVSYVGIKRNFWLKLMDNKLELSLDGVVYKDIREVVSGKVLAGAGTADGQGGVADAINVVFEAFLKK